MSDIFGRKPALAFAYAVFAIGCVLWLVLPRKKKKFTKAPVIDSFHRSGIGVEYWQVLAGRAISGIGGAGMVGLVAVIIAGQLTILEENC